MGLNVEKPSESLYKLLCKIQISYTHELKLLEPFRPIALLDDVEANTPVYYWLPRGFVEGAVGGCYSFVADGTIIAVAPPGTIEGQITIQNNQTFQGWREWHD